MTRQLVVPSSRLCCVAALCVLVTACPRDKPSDDDGSGFSAGSPRDAGMRMSNRYDAGPTQSVDAAMVKVDSGTVSVDGGDEPVDASAPSGDAAVDTPDAAMPTVDAGPTMTPDAAMPSVDAAMPSVDAAMPVVDAGPCGGTGFLVDGVCCNTPCNGVCESCAVPGSVGTCTAIGNGEDPDNECPDMAPETCGTVGTCNGQRACTLHTALCDDGNTCTHSDQCSGGMCRGTPVSCPSDACITRSCNGTATCTELINAGAACNDGDACTYNETCDAMGRCSSGTTVSCDAMDQTCLDYSCNNTPMCVSAPRNVGFACDDGNPMTNADQCRSDGTCAGVMGCALPTDACANGTQSRDRCTGARVIGRSVAGSTAQFSTTASTCTASNRFDDCSWDAGRDHAYRIWMRQGETAAIKLVKSTAGCVGAWDATLKIYESTGCSDVTCNTDIWCRDFVGSAVQNYVATHDGWVVIVVDGSTAFDDWGQYTLTVGLTCRTAGCEC